ncbi:unnamed protein product [Musa acuminata subsp. malaccensis]|uniref:(wild Malaysian banana) hypothetical protein n=2 Tax=Musa acuminata TaxID=4641 RepID=A0A804IRL5_MUSAM|nr:PREDICTED: protein FATTY ACID EXPORT 4, chloroplastic [Musa acuminata subsp. malaccensis]XP_018678846.1 PREDICTED: protein FATTY ACID EXPORT 4, chloroplastic [Musa acuminata subsp. malaccensis]CAG1842780.1 unnamed protein product [Musa acuminata subsp. malaccensis]
MFRSLLPEYSPVTVSVSESETNRSMASISSAAAHLSRSRGPLLFLSSPSPSALNRPACLRISSLPGGAHSIKKSNGAKRYGCCKIPSPTLRCSAQLLGDLAPATSAAYGTLLLGGGLFAYVKSRSKGSILGGLSGACLMAVAYYLMQSPETKELGIAIGFGSAFLFASVFGIRLVATRKFMPSGLLLSLSVGVLAVFLSAYTQAKV